MKQDPEVPVPHRGREPTVAELADAAMAKVTRELYGDKPPPKRKERPRPEPRQRRRR